MKRWILPISLLVLGTLLAGTAGWGANAVLASYLTLPEGKSIDGVTAKSPKVADNRGGGDAAQVEPPKAVASRSRTMTRKAYVDAILARNIFDHTKLGASSAPPCVGEDCDENEKSDLAVTLLATIVAPAAELSSALIMEDSNQNAFGYGVGDKVLDATIVSIAQDRVYVTRADGRQEYISASDGDRPKTSTSRTSSGTDSDDDQIEKTGDNTYVIDKALVDASMNDLDALSRMARARVHKDADGNVDGYRLSGVRRNQLLYKLGVRSGDVIHGVNGTPLTSMQAAMGAMQTLQNEANFSFDITRRGQKMTMQYQVR